MFGQRIREARQRTVPRLSQQSLAMSLGISRASVVNIEAGRQRPPLHVIWQIAEALSVDAASLIPRAEEFMAPALRMPIDRKTMKEIERASGGNQEVQAVVTRFLQSLNGYTDIEVAKDDAK